MNLTERMRQRRWGIFNHYICVPGSSTAYFNYGFDVSQPGYDLSDWNKTVRMFDTDKLAYTLHQLGAGYYFITLIHGTEYMIAPNSAYDRMFDIVGRSTCADRDLVEDLYHSLKKYDIDLCLYFNCLSPFNGSFRADFRQHIGIDSSKMTSQHGVLDIYGAERFASAWSEVLKEYAQRYGDKIPMWWLDSCYAYAGYTTETIQYYNDAIRSANPDALIGFNKGIIKSDIPMTKAYPFETLTCGEQNAFTHFPASGMVDDALTHLLTPLANPSPEGVGQWCGKGTRYLPEFLRAYVRQVNSVGGIVTIDTYVAPDGSFDPKQLEILQAIG